jgi:glycosyltransferase involved in cell wall biosynthesis
MFNQNPAISVVMSVYNSEKYLAESIESILNQTFTDFEFIIINDGSIDNSLAIIESYMAKDDRIVLISRENKGLAASLNEGIAIAKGKYIARMDADDISLPERFIKQYEFMEENQIDLCGTAVQIFSDSKDNKTWRYPEKANDIKFTLMFMTAFAHPTVFIRKKVFDTVSYTNYEASQDYKLWCDIALNGFKMANLELVLLRYRFHKSQISKKNNIAQRRRTIEIAKFYLFNLGCMKIERLFKETVQQSTALKLSDLYHELNIHKPRGFPDVHYIAILRYLLKVSSPVSIKLFFVYLKFSKKCSKDIVTDFYLFIQALLFIKREGRFYQYLKRFVK